jgi:hypothetical protein
MPTSGARPREDDATVPLVEELRVCLARLGSARVVSAYLRGQAEVALDRLRQELARANSIQREMAPLGAQFRPLYDGLRGTAEQLGRAERAAGHTREHARAFVRSIVMETTMPGLPAAALDLVQKDVVRWAMDAYEAA